MPNLLAEKITRKYIYIYMHIYICTYLAIKRVNFRRKATWRTISIDSEVTKADRRRIKSRWWRSSAAHRDKGPTHYGRYFRYLAHERFALERQRSRRNAERLETESVGRSRRVRYWFKIHRKCSKWSCRESYL